MDHLDHLDLEALMVLLDHLENQEESVNLDHQDFLELLVPKETWEDLEKRVV